MAFPRFHVILGPLLAGGLLTACAADDMAGFVPVAETPMKAAAAPGAATPSSTMSSSNGPEVAALPPLPHVTVDEVLGFTRPDLLATFGPPAFRRIDKQAEILRFRGADCMLDVFLYHDGKDNTAGRVAHVEARDTKGKTVDREACIGVTPRTRG